MDERVRTLISIGNAAETREKEDRFADGVRARHPVGQSRAIEPAISGNPRVIPKSWCTVCCCCRCCCDAGGHDRFQCTGPKGGIGSRVEWGAVSEIEGMVVIKGFLYVNDISRFNS